MRFIGLSFLTVRSIMKGLLTVAFKYPNTGLGEVVLKGLSVHSIGKKTIVLVGSTLCLVHEYLGWMYNRWQGRVSSVSGIWLLEYISSWCWLCLLHKGVENWFFSCPEFHVVFCFSSGNAGIVNKSKWGTVGYDCSGGPLVWMKSVWTEHWLPQ